MIRFSTRGARASRPIAPSSPLGSLGRPASLSWPPRLRVLFRHRPASLCRYDFPTPWWDNISEEAKDLVTKLLELDPKTRLTATQVKAHVWCSGNASSAPLADAHKSLKRYNAARKLKKAALGIIAQKKMAAALEGLKAGK